MLTKDHLVTGLIGLARTLEMPPPKSGWVYGHFGAGLIAAYYFQVENKLDTEAAHALQLQVDKLVATN